MKAHVIIDMQDVLSELLASYASLRMRRFPFTSLENEVLKGYSIGCSSACISPGIPSGQRSMLLRTDKTRLQKMGFSYVETSLRMKYKECFECKHTWAEASKKSIDASLINQLFLAALTMKEGEKVIVISSDNDFIPAISLLQSKGFSIERWCWQGSKFVQTTFDHTSLLQVGAPNSLRDEQVHVFIDFSHLWMTMKQKNTGFGKKKSLSMSKLHERIVAGRPLGRFSSIYRSKKPTNRHTAFLPDEDRRFLVSMGYHDIQLPLQVRHRHCENPKCSHGWTDFCEKSVDAALITGMFQASLELSDPRKFILVSGDADFLPVVRFLHTRGVSIETWGLWGSTSKRYRNSDSSRLKLIDTLLDDKV